MGVNFKSFGIKESDLDMLSEEGVSFKAALEANPFDCKAHEAKEILKKIFTK